METLTSKNARALAVDNPLIMDFFQKGYSATLKLQNPKVMNDPLVKPNDYFVNSDFANNPQVFVAHYKDRNYRVLRVIYVDPQCQSNGLGSNIVRAIQASEFDEDFLQVAVELTTPEQDARLDNFYKKLGFQASPHPIDHGRGRFYLDYFWARNQFRIIQIGNSILPQLL